MIARALAAVTLLSLGGCGAIPPAVLMGLQVAGATAVVAKDVFDLDVSIHQQTPGKTPITAVLTP